MRTKITVSVGLLVGACVLTPRPAVAQTPLSLTLEDAIARGVAHAPRLAEIRSQGAAAESTIAARRAVALPTITAGGDYQRTNHVPEFGLALPDGTFRTVFPDIPNMYAARADLTVPIWPVEPAKQAIEAARAEVRAVDADHRVAEQDIKLEVARAYWALVTARQSADVLLQGQQRMDAYVSDVSARVDAGLLGPNDLLTAKAQRARQSVQLIQARNAARIAEVDLARLIGADLGQPIATSSVVTQPMAAMAAMTEQSADALVARAREARAERGGLLQRQTSLKLASSVALGALQPLVSGRASIEPARPNPRFAPRADEWKTSWDIGVHVVVPLFDGGKARANHASFLAQAAAVEHRVEQFDALVAVEIRQRLLDLEAGRAALEASTEALTAFTEARRVVQERFIAGVATSTDVLDAQLALVEAELDHTRLAAAQRVAEARLLRAVGGL